MVNKARSVHYKGKDYTLSEAAAMTGLSTDVIRKRCQYWGVCDAVFETPLVKNKNQYKKAGKRSPQSPRSPRICLLNSINCGQPLGLTNAVIKQFSRKTVL